MAEYEYDPKTGEWLEKPPRRALTPIERWFADWGARNYILYFLLALLGLLVLIVGGLIDVLR